MDHQVRLVPRTSVFEDEKHVDEGPEVCLRDQGNHENENNDRLQVQLATFPITDFVFPVHRLL